MLTVVCPVYNEAENITNLLNQLQASVSVPFELLVVYDRDTDTTLPVLARLPTLPPFRIQTVKKRFGVGALNAIRTGLDAAESEAVLVVMADLSDDLTVVDKMYRMVLDEGFDIVCGSRYMPGGKQIGGPWLKGKISRFVGLSLHYIVRVPTHDVTNSFKMYRKEFLRQVEIESRGGFEIGMELVVKAYVSRRKIGEVPSVWRERTAGKSRFRLLKWAPNYLRWYFYACRGLSRRAS